MTAIGLQGSFIGITGLIGSGKTELATELSKFLNLPVFHEDVSGNPYLEIFYKDKSKYAFPLQIWLLQNRYKQHQLIQWQNNGGIQDRSIYEDKIFAKMLYEDGKMSQLDYQTYLDMFSVVENSMKRPTMLIFLDVSPKTALERIITRGRPMEITGITLEYLQHLHSAYKKFIDEIGRSIPVIVVDYSEFQPIEIVAKAVADKFSKMSSIGFVTFVKPTKQ